MIRWGIKLRLKKLILVILLIILITLIKTSTVLAPTNFFSNMEPVQNIKETVGFGKLLTTHETQIIITGDVMLGRSVMSTSLTKNITYPFDKVAEVLKAADLTLINLENPIIKNCPVHNDGFIFCTDPRMIQGLILAGVDIVSLANNHTKNYGNEGLIQTEKYLKNEKIETVGSENLVIKKINQVNFGIIGFDFTTNKIQEIDYELIKESKEKVDVLIIMIHWGREYTAEPTESQKMIAKKIIESGGDVIAGTHPHWVQSIEYLEGKPVFYSLGNFIFDQSWSEETKKGLVIKLRYQGKELKEIKKMPIYMENFGQPKWVESDL